MTKNFYLNNLLFAALTVLAACGGDNKKQKVVCQGANCDDNNNKNNNYSNDHILRNIIPQLQEQYGSVRVPFDVRVMDGVTMKANTYRWETVYKNYILGAVNKSGCKISGSTNTNNYNNNMSPWGTLNYGCFQNKITNYVDDMSNSHVYFTKVGGSSPYAFFDIFNWFVGTGYSHSQNNSNLNYTGVSNNYDPYWGYRQNWDSYGYGNYGYGEYQSPYQSNGNQFNIRFGGSF